MLFAPIALSGSETQLQPQFIVTATIVISLAHTPNPSPGANNSFLPFIIPIAFFFFFFFAEGNCTYTP